MTTTASSRLRKAFRYPDDDDSSPEDLDDEHQEKLIEDLESEDARKNALYRKAFLLIPLLGAAFFLYTLITASTARQRLIAFLSSTSMGCTAYILHFMPIEKPERKGKMPVYKVEAAKGPLEKYLVYLNSGLVALLQLAAILSWRKEAVEEAWRETMPAIVFGMAMFARQQLAPLDFEDLQRARYELKGA